MRHVLHIVRQSRSRDYLEDEIQTFSHVGYLLDHWSEFLKEVHRSPKKSLAAVRPEPTLIDTSLSTQIQYLVYPLISVDQVFEDTLQSSCVPHLLAQGCLCTTM